MLNRHDLGYLFHPRVSHSDPEICTRLEVTLLPAPSQEHFDPEMIRLNIRADQGWSDTIEISHPYSGAERLTLAPGRVILSDRKHKVVEAYALSGELFIESSPAATYCTLNSPLILPLLNEDSLQALLAAEIEGILAIRRAAHLQNLEHFEQSLMRLTPKDLYCACLNSLNEHWHGYPLQHDAAMQRLHQWVQDELAHLHRTNPIDIFLP
ncbi:MAG: hypothetical protein OHK0052_26460 [Anaerolineales bacterium]